MRALAMVALLTCGCGAPQHRSSVVGLTGGGVSADGRVAWFMEARREVIDVAGDHAPPRDSLYVVRCAMGQVPMCTRTPVDWGNVDMPEGPSGVDAQPPPGRPDATGGDGAGSGGVSGGVEPADTPPP